MSESKTPALLYLEADDEITSVVRRMRAAAPGRVVVVAPGRSRATSSAVALRLLGRAAEESGRELAVVGDALTRSLAAEAGIAAYGSIEDARAATVPAGPPVERRRAAIHVVRGDAAAETAATMPAVAADTQVRPVVRERSRRGADAGRAPARARRAVPPVLAIGAAVVVLLVAAGAAGAVLLPSATITITPRSETTDERTYDIVVDDVQRLGETEVAEATVTATGTYTDQAAATGTVAFRNFNIGGVEVPAQTLVAAGEQAFATTEAIVVPGGSLTADGRIQAGENTVGVVAAAVGPAANVPAEAIDTILDQQIRNRLRGFPQNGARLVLNPEATAGGIDASGPEITQADVDAAVGALRADLEGVVAARLPDDGSIVVRPPDPPDLEIAGADDLVGRRDVADAAITGSLTWEAYRVDADAVRAAAEERFAADDAARPEGHELLPDTTVVTLGDATVANGEVTVRVEVVGRSAPVLSRGAIVDRVAGLTAAEAEEALESIGATEVTLWPSWASTVPELDWRVDVRIVEAEA